MVVLSFIINIRELNKTKIRQCVNSIISQKVEDIEIFINASPLKYIANLGNNSQIRIISEEDECDYKNHCLKEINGDYVCFIDSDECLMENSLLKVLNELNNNDADIFSANVLFNDNLFLKNSPLIKEFDKLEVVDVEEYTLPLYLTKNFFKKEFLEKNNIIFPKKSYSDVFFLKNILDKCDSITTLPIKYLKKTEELRERSDAEYFINYLKEYERLIRIFSSDINLFEYLDAVFKNFKTKMLKLSGFNHDDLKRIRDEINRILSVLNEIPFTKAKYKFKLSLGNILDEIEDIIHDYEVSISVIIPTFNVEKYLDICLNSLINQTFKDIEIIIIDDNSTDNTADTVKFYMKMDNRIKFFTGRERRGPGGARNIGLSLASGKYVMFVDSDDWIDLDSLEKLYQYAEELKTQILMFKGINYDDSKDEFFNTDYYDIKILKDFEYKYFDVTDIPPGPFYICDTPWNKLFLRSFLKRTGAKFPEKSIYEDNPFFIMTFIEAKRVYLIDEYCYNKRKRIGSVSALNDYHLLDKLDIAEEVLKIFYESELIVLYKNILINYILDQFVQCYERIESKYIKEFFIQSRLKLFKFMFEYDLYDDFDFYLNEKNKKFYYNLINTENYYKIEK